MSRPSNGTEDRVRDALDAFAGSVPVSSDAYRTVQAEWRRRERRRRRIAAVVAAVAILLADGVGLWALNRAEHSTHVVFDTEMRDVGEPAGQIGQP